MAWCSRCPIKIAVINQNHFILAAQELHSVMKTTPGRQFPHCWFLNIYLPWALPCYTMELISNPRPRVRSGFWEQQNGLEVTSSWQRLWVVSISFCACNNEGKKPSLKNSCRFRIRKKLLAGQKTGNAGGRTGDWKDTVKFPWWTTWN